MGGAQQSEWQSADWRGRWNIARRMWSEATPHSRRLWLFAFGSGIGLPLACGIAVVLAPTQRVALVVGFAAAYLAVVLVLSARAVVLTRRKP